MKTYAVLVPCTVSICFEIEAENVEDAIDKALETDLTARVVDQHGNDIDVEDFEMHRHVTQGNVFYGVLDRIEVNEV
jgi:hypothetical protein